jgi:hypothetical protein
MMLSEILFGAHVHYYISNGIDLSNGKACE